MQNIDIHLKPSTGFISFIFSLLCFYIGAIIYSSLSMWLIILLIFFASVYGGHIIYRQGFLCANKSIVGLRLLNNKTWMLFTKNTVITGELLGESTVTNRVMILRFAIPGSWYKRTCVICKDAIDPSIYRHLLVHLRYQSSFV